MAPETKPAVTSEPATDNKSNEDKSKYVPKKPKKKYDFSKYYKSSTSPLGKGKYDFSKYLKKSNSPKKTADG